MPDEITMGAVQETMPAKTFSEDYVKSLRGESAGYRTTARSYESALRGLLGLKDGEELGDLQTRIESLQERQAQQQRDMLEAANKRLIQAELRTLAGYDQKLLARVIDLANVKVDDTGNVTGVEEAAKEAAKEYPAVLSASRQRYAPANPAVEEPSLMTKENFLKLPYLEQYELKQNHREQYQQIMGGK